MPHLTQQLLLPLRTLLFFHYWSVFCRSQCFPSGIFTHDRLKHRVFIAVTGYGFAVLHHCIWFVVLCEPETCVALLLGSWTDCRTLGIYSTALQSCFHAFPTGIYHGSLCCLLTMSSNASPQSFPSTYQNPSSFSPAPLLAARISYP
jgi:hypothetical protein